MASLADLLLNSNYDLTPKGTTGKMRLAYLLNQIPMGTPNSPDYDLAGYTNKYGKLFKSPQDMQISNALTGQHLTDEYKLPNHDTFSRYSQYSSPDLQGGQWQQGGTDRWQFSPSDVNYSVNSPQTLADYFINRERKGTKVKLPNNIYAEGTR